MAYGSKKKRTQTKAAAAGRQQAGRAAEAKKLLPPLPFAKGDITSLKIEDIGDGGEGIGRAEGYTLFVKDAVIGDTVKAVVMKTTPRYGYARLLEVTAPSPYRTEPFCPIHRQCGGCQIQALSYPRQLAFKQDKVRGALIRLGGFSPEEVGAVLRPIVGMEEPRRYRNKMQVPVGTAGASAGGVGTPVAGFYAGRTHSIIPMTECGIGTPEAERVLAAVLSWMRGAGVPAYAEETGVGLIRHILVRSGYYTGQVMVCLVVNGETVPDEDGLVKALTQIPGMTSITLNTNTARTNVIMGRRMRTIWGSGGIEDELHILRVEEGAGEDPERNSAQGGSDQDDAAKSDTGGSIRFTDTGRRVRFAISPLSFYQVNPRQTERLYSLALHYAQLAGSERVWDLYCGVGTISLFLAASMADTAAGGSVYGVEAVPEAVRDARENAVRSGLTNVRFEAGLAEEILPARAAQEPADVVVVDPPRAGLDGRCIDAILAACPQRIVYVSCNPATLARDLRRFADGGYRLGEVRPVDMFPHTVHVETIASLQKLNS